MSRPSETLLRLLKNDISLHSCSYGSKYPERKELSLMNLVWIFTQGTVKDCRGTENQTIRKYGATWTETALWYLVFMGPLTINFFRAVWLLSDFPVYSKYFVALRSRKRPKQLAYAFMMSPSILLWRNYFRYRPFLNIAEITIRCWKQVLKISLAVKSQEFIVATDQQLHGRTLQVSCQHDGNVIY